MIDSELRYHSFDYMISFMILQMILAVISNFYDITYNDIIVSEESELRYHSFNYMISYMILHMILAMISYAYHNM
jgi:hypothetical protein